MRRRPCREDFIRTQAFLHGGVLALHGEGALHETDAFLHNGVIALHSEGALHETVDTLELGRRDLPQLQVLRTCSKLKKSW